MPEFIENFLRALLCLMLGFLIAFALTAVAAMFLPSKEAIHKGVSSMIGMGVF